MIRTHTCLKVGQKYLLVQLIWFSYCRVIRVVGCLVVIVAQLQTWRLSYKYRILGD